MIKRFYYDNLNDSIFDDQMGDYPSEFEIYEILNEQDKTIADLESKLADTEFRYKNLHDLYYKDTEELKQQIKSYKYTIYRNIIIQETLGSKIASLEKELERLKKNER